jgi:Ni/Fe-hydrogenase subunit HybB-like protein
MCVTLYFTVLALETAPLFGAAEFFRSRFPRLAEKMRRVHHYAPYLAIVGLGLSLLHQSSLGATYGVLKARPVWYRPDLSVLFILSAMAAGPAFTVLASMLAGRLDRRSRVNDDLMERLAHIIGWVLVGYLYFRFWDAFSMTYTYEPGRTEGLRLLTAGPLSFNFWVLEILLGAALPIVVLLRRRLRQNRNLRMLALALVVVGLAAYRWDTTLVGQMVVSSYLPAENITRYTTVRPGAGRGGERGGCACLRVDGLQPGRALPARGRPRTPAHRTGRSRGRAGAGRVAEGGWGLQPRPDPRPPEVIGRDLCSRPCS